jgi:SNF2 family DNA or RNA helicase
MEQAATQEMSCTLAIRNGRLVVTDPSELLTGPHQGQLFYWGFRFDVGTRSYVGEHEHLGATIEKVRRYFSRHQLPLSLTEEVVASQAELEQSRGELSHARREGEKVKSGKVQPADYSDFLRFLDSEIARPLKEHQLKAALHLLSIRHGANFSVPGSGKTTVVLAVFHWMRSRGEVDSLFVVGPPSCFGPWQTEYELVIGRRPSVDLLAGGDIEDRRSKYYAAKDKLSDLYLTTYQTLQRDWDRVRFFFNQAGVRFFFVMDEAHYIKHADGAWAKAVLNVTEYAKTRCILTGTPFPHTYSDAFNLFDALWPKGSPITKDERIRIQSLIKKKRESDAADVLDKSIGSLFYRVRKSELGLAPQDFQPPIRIRMNHYERMAYDAIVDRLQHFSKEEYFRDLEIRLRLRRGRMIRLRQAISYAKLLQTAVSDYEEELFEDQLSLAELIKHYDELESPAKLTALIDLVDSLRRRGEKIVVWSNFVETLKLILRRIRDRGHTAELIYGETPTENSNVEDELTREQIIAAFVQPSDGIDVLVANPAACAESISLHKQCSHAIYYDLSYNCAQYLQSLDRIHRVGGSEDKVAHYHFLQYGETVDADILANVQRKAGNMSAVIDQDYPIYTLDMFSLDDELAAYERLFG